MFQRFVSKQLALPTGWFGRLFTAKWLEKNNVGMNSLTFDCLELNPRDRLLEVGFGSGYLLDFVLRENACDYVAGVEISEEMLRLVKKRLRHHIAKGKAALRYGAIEKLPYEDGSFTKLCSVNTLYFWRDPSLALHECRRVLTCGGKLSLCFNSKEDLASWPGHVHGFTLYELDDVTGLLYEAGFSEVKVVEARDDQQGLFYCVSGSVV
jgi:arsenite methyltransferase